MGNKATLKYHVPHSSHWPVMGSVGLSTLVVGFVNVLHGHSMAGWLMLLGFFIVVFMMWGWFGNVIRESLAGLYSDQMDTTFRYGMMWFIFSEVAFFAVFFGALFYVRHYVGPWIGGAGGDSFQLTHFLLWPNFQFSWPLLTNPSNTIPGPSGVMHPWGLPAINTLLLLTSGVTITLAHWALKERKRNALLLYQGLTILLGIAFLACQGYEYYHAYEKLGLTLHSGIFGTTFFMLTGFHGAHVTIGTLMLIVIWFRCQRDHFTPERHFAFEAVAWYWHFVDVVWLLLFVFVYWL